MKFSGKILEDVLLNCRLHTAFDLTKMHSWTSDGNMSFSVSHNGGCSGSCFCLLFCKLPNLLSAVFKYFYKGQASTIIPKLVVHYYCYTLCFDLLAPKKWGKLDFSSVFFLLHSSEKCFWTPTSSANNRKRSLFPLEVGHFHKVYKVDI